MRSGSSVHPDLHGAARLCGDGGCACRLRIRQREGCRAAARGLRKDHREAPERCLRLGEGRKDGRERCPVAQSERRAESSQQNSPPVNAEPWAQIGYKKVRKVVEYV